MKNKAEIARINGAKSKGPVSVEGRQRSSRNALKHGLSSRTPAALCLSNEDQSRLDALVACWIAKLAPRDEAELEMVHEIAAHRWRLQRSWSIETATLDSEMEQQAAATHIDEPARVASAFRALADQSQSLNVLGRYEFRLRRQFEQALNNYLRLRKMAGGNSAGDSEEQPGVAA